MPRVPQLTRRRLLSVLAVLGLVAAAAAALAVSTAATGAAPRTEELLLAGAGSPPVDLDATLYLPATTAGPASAVLVAHGFGGSKASVDTDARALADRGFVVLAWSARGFGRSTGQIALDAPDAEVADASRLLDWLATRPEVRLDGAGDPRVGVTGGSYGGALALLLAGYDRRVDAIAPVITWNDLSQALFPNAASTGPVPGTTPARSASGPDGVFKRGWAGVFFSAGLTPQAAGPAPGAPAGTGRSDGAALTTCGRFVPAVCAAQVDAATTGRPSPATIDLLRRSSPASVADRITAPTLIVQGEQDTLFGLDQADATARQIESRGTPVRMLWFVGGHDGGPPGPAVSADIGAWFDYHLAGTGPDPGTGFGYAVDSGVRTTNTSTRTGRTVVASSYPGLSGNPSTSSPVQRDPLLLRGDPQQVLNPPGGSPAAITSVPGVGGAPGNTAGRLAALTSELPGQSAMFRSDPLGSQVLLAGSPQLRLTVARVPGQPSGPEAVLFGKLYELGADGRRSLLGGAVAPMRVAVPAGEPPVEVTVTLPGVVAPIESGNRIMVAISTTDQGYLGATEPAVWRIGLVPDPAGSADPGTPADPAGSGGPADPGIPADPAGSGTLAVPVVPGQTVNANTVPVGPAIGIAAIIAMAIVAGVLAALLRRRRERAAQRSAERLAPAGDPLPLVVDGLAKTYPGGLVAVDGVSFSVRRGMVLGLLGPNGAGKTTVLRMLMGLIRPSGGGLAAFGQPVYPGAPVLARIGSFVESPGFLPHLSGADNLRLYWAATGRSAADGHFADVLRIADLGSAIDRRVRTYSHGMRQRLAIAQAMLGLPDLLVLDEPTNGLDPPQIHAMRDVLRRYVADGRTVLVSSHLLAEVEQTCTNVVVMHHGKVVADGTVAEIIAGGGAATFVVDAPEQAAEVLRSLAGVSAVTLAAGPAGDTEGDMVHANLNGLPRASAVGALVRAGVAVSAAGPRRRLEDAFLSLVGGEAPASIAASASERGPEGEDRRASQRAERARSGTGPDPTVGAEPVRTRPDNADDGGSSVTQDSGS